MPLSLPARLLLGALALGTLAVAWWIYTSGIYHQSVWWAMQQQKALQNELGQLVARARAGEPGVVWSLIAASAFYGFVHALGPGHGKFLIGGAGVASRATARTMAGLALTAALAQGLSAILLTYGGLGLLAFGLSAAVDLTNEVLTPLSYAAVGAIGLLLVWRGARGLARLPASAAGHDHACCAHKHGPTAAEVERLRSWRDAAILVLGIAIRPCTGAVILLVFAWRFGLEWLGVGAVVAMALGTGAFMALVALASVAFREASFGAAGGRLAVLAPAMQLGAGAIVALLAFGLLSASLA